MDNQTEQQMVRAGLAPWLKDGLTLCKSGFLWGLLGAVVGAVSGYLFGGTAGIVRGLNVASLGLAMLAGMFVLGHGSVRNIDVQQSQLSGPETPLPLAPYPWASILVTLFASACCAGFWWLAHLLLP